MIKQRCQSIKALLSLAVGPIPGKAWLLVFIPFLSLPLVGKSQNPFTNPSFEQFTSSGSCNRPVGWQYEDATTNFTDFGKLCVDSTVASDSSHSLQIINDFSGSTNNKAAVFQDVNLASVDSLWS
ncbi:MAG: hypothetical protein BRD50_07180 [Bacteroidetes bacterium SW_11_45_7]|nr:MAG: hypothetical protein BRD50_07180 [Bacteroidetes bacterium SW_11_45_7]